MFLGVRGYALFDWDWLLTVPQLDIGSLLAHEKLDLGVDKLVESAVRLGYTWQPHQIASSFNWSVWRMFMHSRIHHVDEITDEHVGELFQAIYSLEQRVDVTLFFGSTTHNQKIVVQRRRSLYRLHMVLYHRGQVATYPTMERRVEARPVLNPALEQVVRRYLTERRQTARPGTVKNFEVTLRKLVAWLSGCFRSEEGIIMFCRTRSYLSTLRKQGMELFSALEHTLAGHPVLPAFTPPI